MAFSLNHAFIFLVVVLSVFAALYGLMDTEFFTNQGTFTLEYREAIDVRESFQSSDLELYSMTGLDNMTYTYSSLYDHPSAPQFNVSGIDRYAEVWWSVGDYYIPAIQIRDVAPTWWGGYGDIKKCTWKTVDGVPITHGVHGLSFISEAEGTYLGTDYNYTDLTDNWDPETGTSQFYAQTYNFQVSIMFMPTNTSQTIREAWNSGEISYVMSYELDFDAMKPDAWSLVAQLVSFQTVDLGIDGDAGTFFSYALSVAFWAAVAILIFALVTSVVPTISGWGG